MSDLTSHAHSSLFRGEAFEYHFREQESRGVLDTSLRHPWSILLTSIALLCMALTYALFAQVEVVYRAEGTVKLQPLQAGHRGEGLAIAYVHGAPDLNIRPGARVRLELTNPVSGRSPFIDGRLIALVRAPLRLQIALDQPPDDRASAVEEAAIPVRIHAVGCRKSLWRLLGAPSNCLER